VLTVLTVVQPPLLVLLLWLGLLLVLLPLSLVLWFLRSWFFIVIIAE
jgi:hypothetical protein